jgi:hypothetical protein
MTVNTSRRAWLDAVEACGSDPITEENAILQIGREFLPECALVVHDGGEATVEYYEWLLTQTEQAQAEHDAEISAGHEWHGVSL